MCIPPSTMARPESGTMDSAGSMSNEKDSCLTEEYMMHHYKVVRCRRKYAHDWASCPCGHEGERAARRNLDDHPYVSIACHYAKQRDNCPLGDRCTYSHNMFEYWLHPQRFRTEMCQFGAKCNRPVCFYAHFASELRPLDPSLPPPEPCWSAGAMLNKANRQQQRKAALLAHAQAQARSGQHKPSPAKAASCPGQLSSEKTSTSAVQGSAAMMVPQQQQQQMPVLVLNPLPAAETPRALGLSPALPQTHYPQQQQAQQQVVLVQAGQGSSSSAASGGYATVTLPVSSMGVPGVSAGGMQGTVMLQAQQAPQPQPVLQYTMPGSTPQVLQCTMPGSNQPTYWVQVPDPNAVNIGSVSAPMGAGQVVQLELPAATSGMIVPGSSNLLPAQPGYSYTVLDGGFVLQQQQPQSAQSVILQQQPQPAQGMMVHPMQGFQGLSAPPSAGGLVQVGVLDSTAPGMVFAGGPVAVQATELQQQQPNSSDSWQCMYAASTHGANSMLLDLQGMRLG